MRAPAEVVILVLVILAILGIIGWAVLSGQNAVASAPTSTPTPWGTPPWAERWYTYACVLDSEHPTPDAAGAVRFDHTNTMCYSLPPDDVGWQIVEAAAIWGLPAGQVVRCKSPAECAVEAGKNRKCYFAIWYPAGHPEWPQGGWTFRPAPEGFPCRPVPWSIAFPALPYGTPTPIPRVTPISLP